jgi:hypothetical protein
MTYSLLKTIHYIYRTRETDTEDILNQSNAKSESTQSNPKRLQSSHLSDIDSLLSIQIMCAKRYVP